MATFDLLLAKWHTQSSWALTSTLEISLHKLIDVVDKFFVVEWRPCLTIKLSIPNYWPGRLSKVNLVSHFCTGKIIHIL